MRAIKTLAQYAKFGHSPKGMKAWLMTSRAHLLALAAVLFGLAGYLTLSLGSAASVSLAAEAEQGALGGGAVTADIASASAGKAVIFGQRQGFGFSSHILAQDDEAAYLQLAGQANATTLRDDFAWSDIERQKGVFDWNGPDEIMRLTASRGIRVLAIADYSPKWASSCPNAQDSSKCGPVNPADYGNFAGKLAARYGAGGDFWRANPSLPYVPLSGIEIWNEPNIQNFWANPHGGRYANIVKAAYTAIKAADPTITVVAGAMAPVGDVPGEFVGPISFLSQLYDAGAGGYFDAVSHHPYVYSKGATAEYMMAFHDWSGWSQMAETDVSLRSIMAEHGDSGKKIWITEFGAPTNADGISEAEQAKLAAIALEKWKTYDWAGNFYWYSLRDDCQDTTEKECYFGAVRHAGALKPAYTTIKDKYAR